MHTAPVRINYDITGRQNRCRIDDDLNSLLSPQGISFLSGGNLPFFASEGALWGPKKDQNPCRFSDNREFQGETGSLQTARRTIFYVIALSKSSTDPVAKAVKLSAMP